MKKGIFPICLLLVTLVLTGVSCKSTPPAETKPAAFDELQKSSDALTEAVARAEEARKRARDFESPSYFPSDWEAIEAQYTEAGNMHKSTDSEVEEAVALYNSIAESYDELFMKTVPLYAQAREDEIMSAREELINTEFSREFPEYVQGADETTLEALAQYEAGDYYKSRDTAAAALNDYETLLVGARVYRTRQEVIDRNFVSYDLENFNKADEIAQSALDAYDAGDKKAAIATAEEAQLRYNAVLQNSWTSYSVRRRTTASSEREAALENKANIASRDMFREADILYSRAEEEFKAERFAEAGVLFIDAEALYVIASHETDEKRQKALETMRLAEEKIEESVETALEAERIIEGGSR